MTNTPTSLKTLRSLSVILKSIRVSGRCDQLYGDIHLVKSSCSILRSPYFGCYLRFRGCCRNGSRIGTSLIPCVRCPICRVAYIWSARLISLTGVGSEGVHGRSLHPLRPTSKQQLNYSDNNKKAFTDVEGFLF